MWRTFVTLSVACLALVAVATNEVPAHTEPVVALLGDAPKQAQQDDSLVALSPIKSDNAKDQHDVQEERAQAVAGVASNKTVHKEQESDWSRAIRAIRTGAAHKAIYSALGGKLANDPPAQDPWVISLTGHTTTFIVGKTTTVSLNTLISLEDDAFFVFEKVCAPQGKCTKSGFKDTYDSTGKDDQIQKKGTTTLQLKYTIPGSKDELTGNIYQDKLVVGDAKSTSMDDAMFGVVTAGKDPSADLPDNAEAYLGLGFTANAGDQSGNVPYIFSKLPKDKKKIVLWRDAENKNGVIVLGNDTYSKCEQKKTGFTGILQDKTKINQWWFKADKVEAGDQSDKDYVVKLDITRDVISLPKTYIDLIEKQLSSGKKTYSDLSKLPTINIKVGNDYLNLEPELYTTKGNDGEYTANLETTQAGEYHIVLGTPFLKQFCVIFNQQAASDGKSFTYQVGFTAPETKGAMSTTLSVAAVLVVSLVQWLRF